MRVRGLFAPPRLVVALLWLLLLVSLVQADEASEMDEKQPIEKGDATCKSMEEKYNEYKDDGDAAKWLTPCDDTALSGGNVPSVQVPEHGIALDFYSTLPAHADDFGT
jgi:hypothetical protein